MYIPDYMMFNYTGSFQINNSEDVLSLGIPDI